MNIFLTILISLILTTLKAEDIKELIVTGTDVTN